jgi:hypothetical protein
MKYLFVFLLAGVMVSCGDDTTGDATGDAKNDQKAETAKQPSCDDIEGLRYHEVAFQGISKGYLGVVFSCHGGKVRTLGNYKDGKREGVFRQWYENGQLRYEVNFKDDELISEKTWDEKGKISTTEPYSIMSHSHTGPHNLRVFDDYNKGLAYAKKIQKPVLLDFSGHACVNSRKMEHNVWGAPGVIEILRDELVIISLFVDDRTELPGDEQKMTTDPRGRKVKLTTIGQKWLYFQVSRYKTNVQPFYCMLNPNGQDLSNGPAFYERHKTPQKFKEWLKKGLE